MPDHRIVIRYDQACPEVDREGANLMAQDNKSSQGSAFKGNVIYTAFNPVTGKLEQVDAESELAADTMVIPLYWVAAANIYVTVPGTETYGFVPDGGRERS